MGIDYTLEELLLHVAERMLQELLSNPGAIYVFEGVTMTQEDLANQVKTLRPVGKRFFCEWISAYQKNFDFIESEYLKLLFITQSIPGLDKTEHRNSLL